MDKKACDYFLNKGYSCSESIIQSAADLGLVPVELVSVGTGFSGGMGAGCLCGAAAGAQIVLSYIFGRTKSDRGRILAKKFIEKFKAKHKAACCRVLTAKFEDFHSKERKAHCVNMVESSVKILTEILEEAKKEA